VDEKERHTYDHLLNLSHGVRADLLRVLTCSSEVRADIIRQLHDRGLDLAEVLIDMESDELVRWQLVELLRESLR
jgi:hypothetical protein